ncbi:MAG: TraR/DksA C4-type zinc finger protein [Candidatus Pacebacteria bacterium]|nr:TraR/DksA C4-type zinc finger protein [Candidatus Paceibacterota bacterium]
MKIDMKYFKEKLEGEQANLLGELKGLGAIRNPETNDWDAIPEESVPEADENDRADRTEDYEEKTALVNTLKNRLHDVEDALGKIGKSSFGKCEVCGEDIEKERLEANAAAPTCIKHINN